MNCIIIIIIYRYYPFFVNQKYKEELPVFMAWYAEDVTRLVEREVNAIQNEIRKYFPEAQYIDLELGSRYSNENALTVYNLYLYQF